MHACSLLYFTQSYRLTKLTPMTHVHMSHLPGFALGNATRGLHPVYRGRHIAQSPEGSIDGGLPRGVYTPEYTTCGGATSHKSSVSIDTFPRLGENIALTLNVICHDRCLPICPSQFQWQSCFYVQCHQVY